MVKPKRANFDEMVITAKRIVADTEYNFIASINLTKDQKPIEAVLSSIEKIGILASEMRWKRRLFTAEPVFITLQPRKQPMKNYDNIRKDFELASFLNSEERLIKLIQKVKPDELSVNLISWGGLTSSNSAEKSSSTPSDQFPPQHSWLISLSKILYPSPLYTTNVRKILDLLNEISGLLKKITI